MSSSKFDDDLFAEFAALRNQEAIEANLFNKLRTKCMEIGLVDSTTPALDILNLVLDIAFHGVSLEDVIRTRHSVTAAVDAEQDRLRKLTSIPAGFPPPVTVTEYHGDATLRFPCTDGRLHEVKVPTGSRILVYVH